MFRKALALFLVILLLGVFPPLDSHITRQASAWPTPDITISIDTTISTDTRYDESVIELKANLVVTANLTLNSTWFIVNCTSPSEFEINVSSGGALIITNGSMVTPYTLGDDYVLEVSGTLDVEGSTIRGANRVFLNSSSSKGIFKDAMINNTTSTGLYIQTPDLDIQGLTVEKTGVAASAIYVEGTVPFPDLRFKDVIASGGTNGLYVNLSGGRLGNLTLDNVTMSGGSSYGLQARPKDSATISNCTLNGAATGMWLMTDGAQISVTNTTIKGVTSLYALNITNDIGSETNSNANITIADVTVNQSAAASGISATGRKVELYNVKVDGTKMGLRARGNDAVTITGLDVANTTASEAVQIYSSKNVSIGGSKRNTVHNNTDQGIAIIGVGNVTMSNIDVKGNAHGAIPRPKTGVYIGQAGSFVIGKVDIANALLYDNGDTGLMLTATANTFVGTLSVTNSTVSKHNVQGINISNDQATGTLHVADATMDNSTVHAINASRLGTLNMIKTRIDNVSTDYIANLNVGSVLLDRVTVMNAASGGFRLLNQVSIRGDIVVKDFKADLVSGGGAKYVLFLNRTSTDNITVKGAVMRDINTNGLRAAGDGWLDLDGVNVTNTSAVAITIGGIGNATLSNAVVALGMTTAVDATTNNRLVVKRSDLNSSVARIRLTGIQNCTIENSTIARVGGTDIQLTNSFATTYNTTFNATTFPGVTGNATAYWFANARVLNSLGQPVAGLNLSIKDGVNKEVLNITTGALGGVDWFPLQGFFENSSGRDMSTAMHNFTAWNASRTMSEERNMTTGQDVEFVWNTAPRMEGPTNVSVMEGIPSWVQYNISDNELPLASLVVASNSTNVTWVAANWTFQFDYPLDSTSEKVKVNVSDGRLIASLDINVTVLHVNRPPVVILAGDNTTDLTVEEDVVRYVGLNISDKDDLVSALTVTSSDPNVTYLATNTSLRFEYPNNASSNLVYINVSDGKTNVTVTFNVTFMPVNDNPLITTANALFADDDLEYYNDYEGYDIDSDVLSWYVITTAKWLKMDVKTGELKGTPNDVDIGTVRVEVQLKDDDAGTTSIAFDLTVRNRNDAPRFVSAPPSVATVGQLYIYDITVLDEDMDVITLALESGPTGFTVNTAAKNCTWKPTEAQVGTKQVNISAYDGNEKAYQSFSVVVSPVEKPPNNKPVISSTALIEAVAGRLYSYKVIAADIDPWDVTNLTITLVKGPLGMTLDSTWLITWTPVSADAGNAYYVEVSVSDGKDAVSQTFNIYVKLGMDKPSIKLTSPTEMQKVSGKVIVECEVIWEEGPITDVSITVDGTTVGSMTRTSGTNIWRLELDTTDYDNGVRNIVITAKAPGSASNTRSFQLTFDNAKDGGNDASIIGGPLMFVLIGIIAACAAIGGFAVVSSSKKRSAEEARQRRLRAGREEAEEREREEEERKEKTVEKGEAVVRPRRPVPVRRTLEAVEVPSARVEAVRVATAAPVVTAVAVMEEEPEVERPSAQARVKAVEPKKAEVEEPGDEEGGGDYVIPYDKYTTEQLQAYEKDYEKGISADRMEAGGAVAGKGKEEEEEEEDDDEGMEEMEVESEIIEDRPPGREEEDDDEGMEEMEVERETVDDRSADDILDEIITGPSGAPKKDKGPEPPWPGPVDKKKKPGNLSDAAVDKILDEMLDDL